MTRVVNRWQNQHNLGTAAIPFGMYHPLQKILPSRMFQPDLQQLLPERYILISLNEVNELRATIIVNKKRTITYLVSITIGNFEIY